jgi:hypothetical protein
VRNRVAVAVATCFSGLILATSAAGPASAATWYPSGPYYDEAECERYREIYREIPVFVGRCAYHDKPNDVQDGWWFQHTELPWGRP